MENVNFKRIRLEPFRSEPKKLNNFYCFQNTEPKTHAF